MNPTAGLGAVGGERSEPPSATDSRARTAQPSLGLRGERATEPVKPSNSSDGDMAAERWLSRTTIRLLLFSRARG